MNGHMGSRSFLQISEYEGESGALNESFSDFFGTMLEFYLKNGNGNWTIGEDGYIFMHNGVVEKGLRDMADPTSTHFKEQPDTYKGLTWAYIELPLVMIMEVYIQIVAL